MAYARSPSREEEDEEEERDPYSFTHDQLVDFINHLLNTEHDADFCPNKVQKYSRPHRIIVNLLVLVHHKLELAEESLYLGINIFQKMILKTNVPTEKLQLIACTSLWIANKYFKRCSKVGSALSRCSRCIFTVYEMIKEEINIMKVINSDLGCVDPLSFINYYLTELQIYEEMNQFKCKYFLDIIYLDIHYAIKRPSLLAAAAVYSVLKLDGKEQMWTEKESVEGFYPTESVTSISEYMLLELKHLPGRVENNPYIKFCSSKFDKIAETLNEKYGLPLPEKHCLP